MKKRLGWLAAMLLGCGACASEFPWYHDYFTIVTMPHMMTDADVKAAGADAYRASTLWGGWYGGWYVDWQKTTEFYKNCKPRTERLFKRNIMYYDGGEVGDIALFLDPAGNIARDAWNLQNWNGTPPLTAHWFGIDTFFEKQNPFPFSNYTAYGLSPFTWPDGTAATNIYEVLGRRTVDGALEWNESFCNEKITDEQAKKSGLAAISGKKFEGKYVVGRNGWITTRLMSQDYANPQLRDYEAWEMAQQTREIKPDGWHIDNFGDNNLYRPFMMSFGVWSEYTFKQFMKRNFSTAKLAELGIPDIETFDIKQYFRDRKKPDEGNVFSAYDEPKWKDNLIFKCYEINHALESAKFHKAKYTAIKKAAKEAGIDCMVDGNLIPAFAGYTLVNGYVDVCQFEWQATRDYEVTRRPMGLPPQARSGYITRLAATVSKENYSIFSLYAPYDQRGKDHENLFLAQAFEALPNRSVMDFGQQYLDMYSPGTPETAGIYNRFIEKYRKELSRRDFVADIAVIYDQWADIASSTACQLDVKDFFNEYAGWCDYFADTHRQWKVVLSGELDYEKIKDLPMIVLPSALSLTDANFQTLETYLKNGGRVLATGNTGLRFGPEGYLMKRLSNPLENFKKYPGFRWVMMQPAAQYWLSKNKDSARTINSLISWPDCKPAVETDAKIDVGVTLSRSLADEPLSLSLDLNNNNFNVKTDRFTPTELFEVKIHMPGDFTPPFSVMVAAPEKEERELSRGQIQFDPDSRELILKIDPFECYQFLQIRPKEGN